MKDYEERLSDYTSYRLHKLLIFYVPPVLFVSGIVGNILAFTVLAQKQMQNVSAYVYLLVLSVTDSLVLVIGLLRLWVANLLKYDIRNEANWVCKLLLFSGYTISDYSAWLIVAVTAERFVAVMWPMSTLATNTSRAGVKRAIILVVALVTIFFCINLHLFFTTAIEFKGGESNFTNYTSFPTCTGANGFYTLVNVIWPWVDAVLYSVLPVIVLLVLNTLIIVVLFRKKRYRINQLNAVSSSQSLISKGGNDADKGNRLTVTLLAVSFTFLITTFPHSLMLIIVPLRPTNLTVNTILFLKLLLTCSELLMYVNHSINFYLYCITGTKFRRQFIKLILAVCVYNRCISRIAHYRKAKKHPNMFMI